jgi:hypothetical protein
VFSPKAVASGNQMASEALARLAENSKKAGNNGSPGRTRTADPVINSHLLYRLSYRGIVRRPRMLGGKTGRVKAGRYGQCSGLPSEVLKVTRGRPVQ